MNNRIYISGPITGIKNYIETFMAAEEKLSKKGYTVINPAKVLANMPEDTTWSEYMLLALMMLSMADKIYMLKGWENSRGARIEHVEAVGRGMEIEYQ